jgi:hypothetical protein
MIRRVLTAAAGAAVIAAVCAASVVTGPTAQTQALLESHYEDPALVAALAHEAHLYAVVRAQFAQDAADEADRALVEYLKLVEEEGGSLNPDEQAHVRAAQLNFEDAQAAAEVQWERAREAQERSEAAQRAADIAVASSRAAKTTKPLYAFRIHVANVGGQGSVDECTGGLTEGAVVTEILGRTYYAIHLHCGGEPILNLTVGDLVRIDGSGVYRVAETRDVHQGDPVETLHTLEGDVVVQTCHRNDYWMRVVGLSSILD